MSPMWALKWLLVFGLLAGGSFECRVNDDDDDDDDHVHAALVAPDRNGHAC